MRKAPLSEIQKINMFDRYVMRGGLDTLAHFEVCVELCFEFLELKFDVDVFNDVVTDTIRKSFPKR